MAREMLEMRASFTPKLPQTQSLPSSSFPAQEFKEKQMFPADTLLEGCRLKISSWREIKKSLLIRKKKNNKAMPTEPIYKPSSLQSHLQSIKDNLSIPTANPYTLWLSCKVFPVQFIPIPPPLCLFLFPLPHFQAIPTKAELPLPASPCSSVYGEKPTQGLWLSAEL